MQRRAKRDRNDFVRWNDVLASNQSKEGSGNVSLDSSQACSLDTLSDPQKIRECSDVAYSGEQYDPPIALSSSFIRGRQDVSCNGNARQATKSTACKCADVIPTILLRTAELANADRRQSDIGAACKSHETTKTISKAILGGSFESAPGNHSPRLIP